MMLFWFLETNACGDTAGDENYTTLMHIYLELCHVIPDELNLMLKVMDVPIQDISQPAYSCALYSSIGCYYLTFDNSIGDITYSVNIG